MANNITHKYLYNGLFIDHSYKTKGVERNREFWQSLDCIAINNPDSSITIEHIVIEHFSTGIAEDIRIVCNNKDITTEFNRLYASLYSVVPMSLQLSENEDRDAVIHHLIKNNLSDE